MLTFSIIRMITTRYIYLLGYFLHVKNWLAYKAGMEKKPYGAGLRPTGTIWLDRAPWDRQNSACLKLRDTKAFYSLLALTQTLAFTSPIALQKHSQP